MTRFSPHRVYLAPTFDDGPCCRLVGRELEQYLAECEEAARLGQPEPPHPLERDTTCRFGGPLCPEAVQHLKLVRELG